MYIHTFTDICSVCGKLQYDESEGSVLLKVLDAAGKYKLKTTTDLSLFNSGLGDVILET